MTVLIAGAGIGGLTLGLSLHQLGIPFRIFETVAKIQPLGVGINIQPHAVRELFDLGLQEGLDATGLRTEEVAYFAVQGDEIWREKRGILAGYNWPQYSIHRGHAQMLLLDTLRQRAGDVVQMGAAVTGWHETGQGVEITLGDRSSGAEIARVSGDVFVACDGINSAARAALCPQEGPARWGGTMIWRGVTRGPKFLTGRSMAMAGQRACKFVCYPIHDHGDGTCQINWIADLAFPADHDWRRQDWNRQGQLADFFPHFADWSFDWLDIPWVIQNADAIWEYPMVDRNPLPRWSHGRMTLLGDAAHAMYPIGSNGASQAILDARILARELRDTGLTADTLTRYDEIRRETVNALVLANRGDGPDKVLDIVAERAPDGFDDIDTVISRAELEDLAAGYKKTAGMDIAALNARPPLVPV